MTLNKEYYTIYLLILAFIGLFVLYRAYRKGFFFQLLDVVSSFGIIFYSFGYCSQFARTHPIYTLDKETAMFVNTILWFVICYIVFRIIYYFIEFLLKAIAKILFKNRTLKFINRLMGVLVGVCKVLIIYTIVCMLCLLPIVKNGNDFVNQTPLVYIKDFLIANRKVVGINV